MEPDLQSYADKLYELHKETMSRAHNLSVIHFGLSLLTLGLSTGVLTLAPSWTVGGLSLTSSQTYVLLAIFLALVVVYIYIVGLTIHSNELFGAASECYAASGNPSTVAAPHALLRFPDLGSVLMNPKLVAPARRLSIFGWSLVLGIIIASLLVPLGAALTAAWSLCHTDIALAWKTLVVLLATAVVVAAWKLISVSWSMEKKR